MKVYPDKVLGPFTKNRKTREKTVQIEYERGLITAVIYPVSLDNCNVPKQVMMKSKTYSQTVKGPPINDYSACHIYHN